MYTNQFINIGHGNLIPIKRIVAIINYNTAPAKKMVQDAKESGMLVNSTQGRRFRSVLVMDSRHIIVSSMQPETLNTRMLNKNASKDTAKETE